MNAISFHFIYFYSVVHQAQQYKLSLFTLTKSSSTFNNSKSFPLNTTVISTLYQLKYNINLNHLKNTSLILTLALPIY